MSVREAMERDLKSLPEDLRSGTLAALALTLAAELDASRNGATAKSNCTRALLDTLDRLEELKPEVMERGAVDELVERRAKRLAGGAGTTD